MTIGRGPPGNSAGGGGRPGRAASTARPYLTNPCLIGIPMRRRRQQRPPPHHRIIVRLQAAREHMPAAAVGDEVKILAPDRMQHRLQTLQPRRAIGAGGSPALRYVLNGLSRVQLRSGSAGDPAPPPRRSPPYTTVGSASSRIPSRSRFRYTAATCGRSSGFAVSRSTMLARINASRGLANGKPGARSAHKAASSRSIAAAARSRPRHARRAVLVI